MKILFAGSLGSQWSLGWQRAQTLRDLGHDVVEFGLQAYDETSRTRRLLGKLTHAYFTPAIIERCNSDFLGVLAK